MRPTHILRLRSLIHHIAEHPVPQPYNDTLHLSSKRWFRTYSLRQVIDHLFWTVLIGPCHNTPESFTVKELQRTLCVSKSSARKLIAAIHNTNGHSMKPDEVHYEEFRAFLRRAPYDVQNELLGMVEEGLIQEEKDAKVAKQDVKEEAEVEEKDEVEDSGMGRVGIAVVEMVESEVVMEPESEPIPEPPSEPEVTQPEPTPTEPPQLEQTSAPAPAPAPAPASEPEPEPEPEPPTPTPSLKPSPIPRPTLQSPQPQSHPPSKKWWRRCVRWLFSLWSR